MSLIKQDFSTGRLVRPAANVQDMIGDYQNRLMKDRIAAEDRALREKSLLQQQANADRGFGLKEEAAKQLALENERRAGVDTAKLIMQSEAAEAQAAENVLNKKYRANMLQKQEEALQYKKDMDLGEAQGAFVPFQESITTQTTEDVVDKDAAGKMFKDLGSTVSTEASDDEIKQAYHEYRKANDPSYTQSGADKFGDNLADIGLFGPKTIEKVADTVSGLFTSKSDAEAYEDSQTGTSNKAPSIFSYKPEAKVKSFKDFAESYNTEKFGTEEERTANKKAALKSVQDWVLSKDSGVVTQKVVDKVQDVPKEDMLREAYSAIQKKKVSKTVKTGMMKAAAAKIEKLDEQREAASKIQLTYMMNNMKEAQKQQYRLELEREKDRLGRKLTPKEQVDIAYKKTKMDAIKKDMYDKDNWF